VGASINHLLLCVHAAGTIDPKELNVAMRCVGKAYLWSEWILFSKLQSSVCLIHKLVSFQSFGVRDDTWGSNRIA
jgi:hypothetical protein